MKFKKLASYIEKIEATSLRLSITTILAELFSDLTEPEIGPTVYLLQGRISPQFSHIEFGMAEKMIIRSIVNALNVDKNFFENKYKHFGDLGKAVENFKHEIRSFEEKDLSILEVYDDLVKVAKAAGPGSQEVKTGILSHLIRQLDSLSCRYLVRIPAGVMRLGFSDMTVLDALSFLIKKDKSLRPSIQKAYQVRPDLGFIAQTLKKEGIKGLDKIKPSVFTPILMMRAERLPTAGEIIEKIGKCAVEEKFDGFRLQVHIKKNEVKLYSRNLEDVTAMYPDVVEGIVSDVDTGSAILEGEAIGYDPISGNFLPFQETVQRKRKYDIEAKAKEIPLKLFVFDLLYLDGEKILEKSFIERRRFLEKIIKRDDGVKRSILLSPHTITDEPKKLELLFDDAISRGLEGIVAKKLEGFYEPGARNWNWIKFKRSYSQKIEDSVDCLVMGYDLGRGKRTAFGIGAFLVGVLDEEKDRFVTVSKIGTGLTDEEWKELKVQGSKFKVQNKPKQYEVDAAMAVDIWINPEIVVEIKADEITRSSVHTAGRILKKTKSGNSLEVDQPGFALRFPRLVRFRKDKKPFDVTTIKEIKKMYKDQSKR